MRRKLTGSAPVIQALAAACLCLHACPGSAIEIKLHGIDGKKVNRLLDQTERLTSVLEKLVSTEPGSPLYFYIDKIFEEANKTVECALGQTRVTVQELAADVTPKWMQSFGKCQYIGSPGELTIVRVQVCKIHNSIVDKEPAFDEIVAGYSGNLRVTQAALCSRDLLSEDRADIEAFRDDSALLDKAYRKLNAVAGCDYSHPEEFRQCAAKYSESVLTNLRAKNPIDLQYIDLPDLESKIHGLPPLPAFRRLSSFGLLAPGMDVPTLEAYEQLIAEAYEYSAVADATLVVRQTSYNRMVSDAKAAIETARNLIPGSEKEVERHIECNLKADARCRVNYWEPREKIVAAKAAAEASCADKVFIPQYSDLVTADQKQICGTDLMAVKNEFERDDAWADARIRKLNYDAVRQNTKAGQGTH